MILNHWPWFRPTSLRSKLLVWIALAHILAAVLVAWGSHASVSHMVATARDDLMETLAQSYAHSPNVPVTRDRSAAEVIKRGIFVIQIWSSENRLLSTSLPDVDLPLLPSNGFSVVRTASGDDADWRVYSTALNPVSDDAGAQRVRVQVGLSNAYIQRVAVEMTLRSVAPIVLLLPLSFAVLWFLVSSSSKALRALALDVSRQDDRDLSEISPTRVPDEIAPLVIAYNSVLTRLRHAFTSQGRFVQDAAHELRTPITAISLQLENLRTYVPEGDAAESLAQLEGGVERSSHLIEQLLHLSRQENETLPQLSHDIGEVDVAAILRDSIGQLMFQADQRQMDLGFEGRASATVRASISDLRSVFDNLIGNALRYSHAGGVVDVLLYDAGDHSIVDIIDNGPGIDPEFIDRAFDRFFRVPGTGSAGSGLGLAIAQMAAQRNGLRLQLINRAQADPASSTGLIARVHLPQRAEFRPPSSSTARPDDSATRDLAGTGQRA